MCGRYSLDSKPESLARRFEVPEAVELLPRFNIAPSTELVAVVLGADGKRHFDKFKWGLLASWADAASAKRPINARAEGIGEKPTFRDAVMRRRCLIPASGFYEWKKEGKEKRPYHIRRRDGGLFAFAGLYEERSFLDAPPLKTCCIMTIAPNVLVAPIHDRMPCILAREVEGPWLDVRLTGTAEALSLLRPYPDAELEAYPVSSFVNTPRNDGPECVRSAS